MTVVLDYALSERLSGWATKVDLAEADETILAYDCFCGDITFVVGDADFSARWGWVTVLAFALQLWRASRRAALGEPSQVSFTENESVIYLSPTGRTDVTITCDYGSSVGTIRATTLEVASERFLRRVIDELCEQYPALRSNAFVLTIPLEIEAGRR